MRKLELKTATNSRRRSGVSLNGAGHCLRHTWEHSKNSQNIQASGRALGNKQEAAGGQRKNVFLEPPAILLDDPAQLELNYSLPGNINANMLEAMSLQESAGQWTAGHATAPTKHPEFFQRTQLSSTQLYTKTLARLKSYEAHAGSEPIAPTSKIRAMVLPLGQKLDFNRLPVVLVLQSQRSSIVG